MTRDVIEYIEQDMKSLKLTRHQMYDFWTYAFDMDNEDMLRHWEAEKG